MILDEIIKNKREEVKGVRDKQKQPLDLEKLPKVRDFAAALQKPGIKLIAEVKAKSPSAGVIVKDFDPVKIARAYEKSGVSAISVLTDNKYFGGSIEALKKVKASVKLPVLRKDFIIDESQIYESRIAGADAVLLIVRILRYDELERFIKIINDLGMTALVEVHSADEAKKAIDAGANVIGINNRDLDTLKVDLNTTSEIIKSVPELKEKNLVSESGIKNKDDVKILKNAGVKAILAGEAILKAKNIEAKINELFS